MRNLHSIRGLFVICLLSLGSMADAGEPVFTMAETASETHPEFTEALEALRAHDLIDAGSGVGLDSLEPDGGGKVGPLEDPETGLPLFDWGPEPNPRDPSIMPLSYIEDAIADQQAVYFGFEVDSVAYQDCDCGSGGSPDRGGRADLSPSSRTPR